MPVEEKEIKQAGLPSAATKKYVVKAGDTLTSIAAQMYGDGNLWPKIFEANKDIISDPNVIRPGQELRIPPK